jgi:nucleoid-associated protein EbfC
MNINDLMGKAQEMQARLEHVKHSLNTITVEAESGGGLVKVVATAARRVSKISVDPQLLDDREMLEDLLVAAINKALGEAEDRAQEELAKTAQGMFPGMPTGLNMPGGFPGFGI